tara:strand:+ start:11412 stop:11741 length:330 start_codon:yes stop_codon:yes gene_type:complete
MGLFRRKKVNPVRISKPIQYNPGRKGKTRIDSRKVRSFNRRYQKRSNKLASKGFTKTGGKPLNQMSSQEYRKLEKRIKSGNYDVETVVQPPKWKNEPPREWVMTRRKKK